MASSDDVTRDGTADGSPDLNTNSSVEYFLVLYRDIGAMHKNYLPCISIEYHVGFIIYLDQQSAIHRIISNNIIPHRIIRKK